MRKGRLAGTLAAVAILALLGVASGVSLVITVGTSMLPRISAGDLVITLPAPTYDVGDTAAYFSPMLDTVVLHRIVAVEDDSFAFQGDNNSWLDPETPGPGQLVGKEWLHIPRGGIWLRRAISPPALAGFAFLLVTSGGAVAQRRRRRRRDLRTLSDSARHRPSTARPPRPRGTTPRSARLRILLRPLSAGVAVLALAALILGSVAWSRPTMATVTADESVTSTVDFSYSATVRPSPAYDDTTVTAPQPIFRELTESVDVTFSYAGPPATVAVDAELAASSGWTATVPLAAPVTFDEEEHTGTVTLDLRALQRLVDEGAEATGIPASNVSVTVLPTFTVQGGEFVPPLAFTLEPLALRMAQTASAPDGDATDPLSIEESTTVSSTTRQPARLEAFDRGIAVTTARGAAMVALGVAALLGLILGIIARRTRPVGESDRINLRYAHILLPVEPIVLPPGRPVIDVPTVDALVKLAERYGLLVLHWSRAHVETYIVQDEGTTYRYRANTTVEPRAEQKQPVAV